MKAEYIVKEGQKITFSFEGKQYIAYVLTYSTGNIDVIAYDVNSLTLDIPENVKQYAWNFFESIGLI